MGHYISDAEGNLTKIAGKDYKAYMPLGMIFASAVMLEEGSVKRLDGQSLSITGTYKDFCNWVIKQGANAPTCNISTYASEMTTYGQCGKFVINNTNSAQTSGSYTVPAYSIKLPTITEFVASNNGGDAIGLAELDEFKSHAHGVNVQQGVYTVVQNGSGDWCATYSNNSTLTTGGEETRPKNIRYPYYIVVAQGVKPIALADMTKKAEKDGSNLTDADVENWQNKLGLTKAWAGNNVLDLSNKNSLSDLYETILSAGKNIICTGRVGTSDGTSLASLIGTGSSNYARVFFEVVGENSNSPIAEGGIIRCTAIGITAGTCSIKYLLKGNFTNNYVQTSWKSTN